MATPILATFWQRKASLQIEIRISLVLSMQSTVSWFDMHASVLVESSSLRYVSPGLREPDSINSPRREARADHDQP